MQVEDVYMNILKLKDKEVDGLLEDEETPVLIKVICQNIRGGNNFRVVQEMFDRTLWKAIQKTEDVTSDTINEEDLSD